MKKELENFCMKNRRSGGFTLAEVLITLGIIGVVAALTVPAIIHKQQTIALKSGFKKGYNEAAQALISTKAALGTDNLQKNYCVYNPVTDKYTNASVFINEYYK